MTPPDSTRVTTGGPRPTGAMGEFKYNGESYDKSCPSKPAFVQTSSVHPDDPFFSTPSRVDAKLNVAAAIYSPQDESSPAPIRPDRVGQPVTPENAQGVFPAQNAVFVAK